MIKKISIGILSFVLIIFIFLFIVSPGTTSPIVDGNGNPLVNSIAVIEKPIIGGIPQGIIIRGENINNPVLLYVHGGPGGPSYPMYKNDLRKLKNYLPSAIGSNAEPECLTLKVHLSAV
jgi:hypothetical protein